MKGLNPLFKCYGSKWSSSKHYPPPLDGLPIFEPFAGSAGYSLRYHWFDVVLWETNPLLQELWLWIINEATSQDILDIPLNLPIGTDIRTLGLTRGQQLLLKHWQRTNNVGPCMTISPWGDKPGQWTENTRARVSEEIHAVKHWKFQEPKWNEIGTWHIDGPYQFNYQYGVKDFDYGKLSLSVHQLPVDSLVMVCEAVCPKTGKVPNYLPFEPSHLQVTSRRKYNQSHHSRELIYVRRP
jgi:hypothetical protein